MRSGFLSVVFGSGRGIDEQLHRLAGAQRLEPLLHNALEGTVSTQPVVS
ncbi:hypothetical protein BJ971_005653 [Actinoplanes digitatis]|uniref:Uncharacterized protein n=1 Tax=Actinoplanes digitatis TaxID=1868 RepID=A0A7W7MST1_9ACTN|nr:hypothetical protein [Actinoplanes digitatis]